MSGAATDHVWDILSVSIDAKNPKPQSRGCSLAFCNLRTCLTLWVHVLTVIATTRGFGLSSSAPLLLLAKSFAQYAMSVAAQFFHGAGRRRFLLNKEREVAAGA